VVAVADVGEAATLLEVPEDAEVTVELEEATDAEDELPDAVPAAAVLVEVQETALGTVTGGFAVKQICWAYCTAVA
jgi:hypothetical protein